MNAGLRSDPPNPGGRGDRTIPDERSAIMYGKQTERAIGAMSRLAEVWDSGKTRLSAFDIADERGLPRPMVAKILTALSQANLVVGSPGPGGGYALSRPPSEITLRQVYELFEREDQSTTCPFGGGVCGAGEPCALHDRLVDMQKKISDFLCTTTFEEFRVASQERGLKPAPQTVQVTVPRESFRAREPRKR
jgi:Rrf2 family transcriptional regulator, iron-sulfur cluster assembly transcription factor